MVQGEFEIEWESKGGYLSQVLEIFAGISHAEGQGLVATSTTTR